MAGFDFAALDTVARSEEGRRVVIVHMATGLPLEVDGGEVAITTAGPDSVRARHAKARANRRVADFLGREGTRSPEEIADFDYENTLLYAADLLVAWENVALDGQELEATPENAARLYRRVPHAYEQVDAGGGARVRFLAA